MRPASVLAAVAALGASGCRCADDATVDGLRPVSALTPCAADAPTLDPPVQVRVTLRVGGVPAQAAEAALRQAAAVWGPAGVELVANGPAQAVPLEHAFTTSAVDPARPDIAAVLRGSAAALTDLATLEGDVVLLVTRRLAAPDSPISRALPGTPGLTLTQGGGGPRMLAAMMGWPAEAPPLVVIGWQDLADAGGTWAEITPAHELGHALGLPHAAGDADLMSASPPACRPAPTRAQLDALHVRRTP